MPVTNVKVKWVGGDLVFYNAAGTEIFRLDGDGGAVVPSGAKQAHVADASTAHALNATFSDTEVEAALNALGTKINSILVSLETFGIHATS